MTRPLMVNAFDPAQAGDLGAETEALLQRRARVLGPSYKLFYEEPVHVVKAEGVWLYGPNDEKYLDVYNNVPSVGHCHPKVIGAVTAQMATLNVHTRYLNDVVLTYAEELLATFPAELSRVMFACTGSESSDLAMRIAKAHTGGTGIIVTENAYHGITEQISLMSPSLGEGMPLGPNVRTVPAPDAYRQGAGNVGPNLASAVRAAMADLKRHGFKPAAMIADMIFSSDGIYSHPAGFMRETIDTLHAEGALFIADEVQPGFARLGDTMWGFQRHGIVPDMAIMGKPMGNGLPVAGVVAKPEVLGEFATKARYFNTFGGNPVSIAAAQATLDVIKAEGLQENARAIGERLKKGLAELAPGCASMGDVRGAGLFVAADFVVPGTKTPNGTLGLYIVNALRERRILISACGLDGNVLKIRPPLPFYASHADYFLDQLAAVLKSDKFRRLEEQSA